MAFFVNGGSFAHATLADAVAFINGDSGTTYIITVDADPVQQVGGPVAIGSGKTVTIQGNGRDDTRLEASADAAALITAAAGAILNVRDLTIDGTTFAIGTALAFDGGDGAVEDVAITRIASGAGIPEGRAISVGDGSDVDVTDVTLTQIGHTGIVAEGPTATLDVIRLSYAGKALSTALDNGVLIQDGATATIRGSTFRNASGTATAGSATLTSTAIRVSDNGAGGLPPQVEIGTTTVTGSGAALGVIQGGASGFVTVTLLAGNAFAGNTAGWVPGGSPGVADVTVSGEARIVNPENANGSVYWSVAEGGDDQNRATHLAGDTFGDFLSGGLGADTLSGGAGRDSFFGTAAQLAGDTIADIQAGETVTVTGSMVVGASLSGQTLTIDPDADAGTANAITLTLAGAAGGVRVAGNVVTYLAAPTDIAVTGAPLGVAETSANGTVVGTVRGADPESQPLTYSLSNDAGGRFAIDPVTGVITVANGGLIDFETARAGYQVAVTVRDSDALAYTETVTIAIADIAEAPVLAQAIADQAAPEDKTFLLRVPAGAFVDPDGAGLTYAATLADGSALPAWLTFDAAARTFSGTPRDADVGSFTVRITASDGTGSAQDLFLVTVADDAVVTAQNALSLEGQPDVEELTFAGSGNFVGIGNRLANQITGGAGNDKLHGLQGDDLLVGGAGRDRLNGKQGDDDLVGGAGKDVLRGGVGRDAFVFTADSDSGVGTRQRDVIKAFVSGQDVIDLSGIDTDAGAGGDQTFAWAGAGNVAAAFTGRKGELRFADGILQGDLDGDGRADFEIGIAGALAAGDVIL